MKKALPAWAFLWVSRLAKYIKKYTIPRLGELDGTIGFRRN
jgi:hypothetical protein